MNADPKVQYKKLPGTGYRQSMPVWAMALLFLIIGIFVLLLRGKRVQVWEGEDHLLIVDWDGYRETYKRIRFADIQWISIHKSPSFAFEVGAIGVVALIVAGIGIALRGSGAEYVLFPCALFFMGLAVAHYLLGQTCGVQLATAVQVEQMVSFKRVKQVRNILDKLRPKILQAQAGFVQAAPAPGDVTAVAETQAAPAASPEPEAQPQFPPAEPAINPPA